MTSTENTEVSEERRCGCCGCEGNETHKRWCVTQEESESGIAARQRHEDAVARLHRRIQRKGCFS